MFASGKDSEIDKPGNSQFEHNIINAKTFKLRLYVHKH